LKNSTYAGVNIGQLFSVKYHSRFARHVAQLGTERMRFMGESLKGGDNLRGTSVDERQYKIDLTGKGYGEMNWIHLA
jgi:hypothetical protein